MTPAIVGSRQARRIAAARTSASAGDVRAAGRTPTRRRPARSRAAESPRCRGRTRRGRTGWRARRRRGGRRLRGRAACSITRSAPSRRRSPGARRGRAPGAAPCASCGRAATWAAEKPLLGALLPRAARRRPAASGSRSLFDGVDERLERGGLRVVVAAADQHAVAAGLDRQHRRGGHRVAAGDRLHLEIVAQDDALVAQLLAQEARDDAPRQRRRPRLVERRHEHVRGHDGRDPGLDGRPERHELDLAQPIGRMLDERQLEVRIGAGVAVPGKVLAAGGDALALQRADDRGARAARPRRPSRPARDRR